MSTFKIWIEVEEVDEIEDHVTDVELDFASVAEFETMEEAIGFARHLQNIGETLNGTTIEEWKLAVANGHTVLGYQDWREHFLESFCDDATLLSGLMAPFNRLVG